MIAKKEKRVIALKLAFFIVVVFLFCTHYLRADNGALNIFEDRDQDGLSDEEEKMYGTDPLKADTDGDGYSDKIEIESGYDPLKPAPGDKIISEKIKTNQAPLNISKEKRVNLTDQLIENIQNQKKQEFEILQDLKNNPDKFTDQAYQDKLQEISLTEGDLQSMLSGSISGESLEDKLELISENEIKLLPEPKGTDKEKKKVQKKQIEEYLTAIGYVLMQDSPINIKENISIGDLESQASDFLTIASGMFEEGNIVEINKIKEKAQSLYDNLKKIEVPVKMKDTHIKALSLVKYLLKDDSKAIANPDDPISQLFFIGKVRATMNEFSALIDEAQKIIDDYEIDLAGGLMDNSNKD